MTLDVHHFISPRAGQHSRADNTAMSERRLAVANDVSTLRLMTTGTTAQAGRLFRLGAVGFIFGSVARDFQSIGATVWSQARHH